jgi:hypothetical protein
VLQRYLPQDGANFEIYFPFLSESKNNIINIHWFSPVAALLSVAKTITFPLLFG